MDTSDTRIAGQSTQRIAALSHGVFAVAMTLLVLDLKTPVVAAIHGEADLAHRWPRSRQGSACCRGRERRRRT